MVADARERRNAWVTHRQYLDELWSRVYFMTTLARRPAGAYFRERAVKVFAVSITPVPRLVSLDLIRDAASRIQHVARATPLVDVSDASRSTLLLKCENLQLGGAFKIRGAFNTIAQLTEDERGRGVITYSSGNHGWAVALAAQRLGAPAVIVMPTSAPQIKVDGVRERGGEVIFEGTTSAERKVRAESEAAERNLTMVPPFDHPWIIAGQGTIGVEILADCPEVSEVLVPIGGGGLIAGVASAVKQQKPTVRVIGVEPSGAAKMKASMEAGQPITLDKTLSIADGLLPVRPGDLTFAHVHAFVDEVVTVEDEAIAWAVVWLFRRAKLVVEPSGAATVAAFHTRAGRASGARRVTVAVLSGGNMAPETLTSLLRTHD